jgi:plastocyanin
MKTSLFSESSFSRWAWLVGLLVICHPAQLLAVDLVAKVAWENVSRSEAPRKNKDVVVWLTPVDPASTPAPQLSAAPLTLIQRNKSFEPHVLVVPVGSVIQFPNRDPFFHNVFSLFEGKRFDLGLYEAGTSRNVHFDKPGVSYIFCNIHPEMSAVVIALTTPFHATSDARGNVVISDVPPGRYRLHLWYEAALPEELDAMTREITVADDASNLGVLSLKFTSLAKAHKNKYGQDYEPPNPGNPAYLRP